MSSTELPINFADISAAAARLKGVAHRTPVHTSSTANARTGAELFFKCENFQRMGAFKFRGGYNALAQFSPEQRKAGAIAFSSGNHAQAIALSAKLLGMQAVIVMPQDAPEAKIRATREYGAEIVLFDRYTQDREALTQQIATERGMTLIPPYNHAHVMAGQGTAALELIEDVTAMGKELDVLLVCMGGGGLTSGCAVAAQHLLPQCDVYGVEPLAGNDFQQSFRSGQIVKIDVPKTIADGAQTQSPGPLTFAVCRALLKDVLTVDDNALVKTMRFFAERMKMVIEPTGGLAAAAAMLGDSEGKLNVKGKRVGIIVSGGNLDPAYYAKLLRDGV
jgi:threo-3-hydroxy-L-aspartate ammonia-lyase